MKWLLHKALGVLLGLLLMNLNLTEALAGDLDVIDTGQTIQPINKPTPVRPPAAVRPPNLIDIIEDGLENTGYKPPGGSPGRINPGDLFAKPPSAAAPPPAAGGAPRPAAPGGSFGSNVVRSCTRIAGAVGVGFAFAVLEGWHTGITDDQKIEKCAGAPKELLKGLKVDENDYKKDCVTEVNVCNAYSMYVGMCEPFRGKKSQFGNPAQTPVDAYVTLPNLAAACTSNSGGPKICPAQCSPSASPSP